MPTNERITARPKLAEPVSIAEFWANRSGQSLRVQIGPYGGRAVIDIRKYTSGADGRLHPTKIGVCLVVRRLPELAAAINKALTKARELGLLDGKGRADG
jgi:Transcriptional Coactivator p15 (PC4)